MFSNVPCTRITGYGWAAPGRHEKSFAPGGGSSGKAIVTAKAAAKS
jgi:hypothetical protein